MQIPETPKSIEDLDLMKLLRAYAEGRASWLEEGEPGPELRAASRTLHNNIVDLASKIFSVILDRVSAREMDTFTMHDRVHGLKVAHLMWHILDEPRRERLTPPEIGILVSAAHLHDMGMALSREERLERLAPRAERNGTSSPNTSEE